MKTEPCAGSAEVELLHFVVVRAEKARDSGLKSRFLFGMLIKI